MFEFFNPFIALWHCIHEFCFNCPKFTKYVLEYFDNGGLIPSIRPLEFFVPETIRPDWVCKGLNEWFPPGWKSDHWKQFIISAHKNTSFPNEQKIQQWAALASKRKQNLEIQLHKARFHLKKIKTCSNIQTHIMSPLWDIQALSSFFIDILPSTVIPQCDEDDKFSLSNVSTLKDLKYIASWI